ncbi:hypothetical protein Q8F55_005474 [Vanrija albida]|uniref:Uncharacterized protein n=1 Tax=Vanrija albida TaxID=181172 RepID=A0ABR3Q2H8_9TREE
MILDLDNDEFHDHAERKAAAVGIPMPAAAAAAAAAAAGAQDTSETTGTSPAGRAILAEDALVFSSVLTSWAEGMRRMSGQDEEIGRP